MADKKISQLPASTTPLAGVEELAIVQSGSTKKVNVENLLLNTAKTDESNTFNGNQTILNGDVLIDNGVNSTLFLGKGAENVDGVAKLKSYQSGADTDQLGISFYVHPSTVGGAPAEEAIRIDHNQNLVFVNSGNGIDFSADSSAAGMTSELLDDYEEGTWTPDVTSTTGTITTVGTVVGRYTKVGRQVTVWFSATITDNGTGSGAVRVEGLPFSASNNLSYYSGVGGNANSAKTIGATFSGSVFLRYADATYPVASGETIFATITYNV